MSAAVSTLKRELEEQEQKLEALAATHRDTIDAGRRALAEVGAQQQHVEDLRQAIEDLENIEEARRLRQEVTQP